MRHKIKMSRMRIGAQRGLGNLFVLDAMKYKNPFPVVKSLGFKTF